MYVCFTTGDEEEINIKDDNKRTKNDGKCSPSISLRN